MDFINTLSHYLQYDFVKNAMIVGLLISLCSSLLGASLVLKRFSFIGDGLAHVAFGATAIATALRLTNNFYLVLPLTIVCAILLLRMGQSAKIKGDAALAMLSVGALGIGYLVMNIFSGSSNLAGDVCATLFGSTSILTLTRDEIWLSIVLSVLVVCVFIFFYHRIFAVTFDEDFALATGTKAKAYNLLLAVVIAVVIVVAMSLVGTLLISALVIFPALSAMRVFKSFRSVVICSVAASLVYTGTGLLLAIYFGTPVGSTIVAVDIVGFLLFSAVGAVKGHRHPVIT